MDGQLGKYELRGTLGRGAVGVVYEGWDPAIARRVAIKTVRVPDAADEEAREELRRFRREAQAAGRLSHPNIVGVFDYGETEEFAYIVMEFIEGETLKTAIERGHVFPIAEVIELMRGLLRGLGYSHSRGVVHRDIKPANLMLPREGGLKIADFGIARLESGGATQVGTFMGTPAYMSPEQIAGDSVDARTDLYSAGVVLYVLLTGQRPFEGSLTTIIQKALHTEAPRPSEIAARAPVSLDRVVRRAMQKRAEDRFPNAAAFEQALDEVAAEESGRSASVIEEDATLIASSARPSVASSRESAPRKRWPAPVLGLAVLAAVLAGGGGGWWLLRTPGNNPAPHAVPVAAPPPAVTTPLPTVPSDSEPMPAPASPLPDARLAPPSAAAPRRVAEELAPALAAIPCALMGVRPDGAEAAVVTGLIGDGAPRTALDRAIAGVGPDAPVRSTVQVVPATHCGALDLLRPLATGPDDAAPLTTVLLPEGRPYLIKDEPISVSVRMPFAGELRIDYLSSDGTVFHAFPPEGVPRVIEAGQIVRPGRDGVIGSVEEPYGTDMVIATASSVPLFAKSRSTRVEKTDVYLEDLGRAIDQARGSGARVVATAAIVQTRAR